MSATNDSNHDDEDDNGQPSWIVSQSIEDNPQHHHLDRPINHHHDHDHDNANHPLQPDFSTNRQLNLLLIQNHMSHQNLHRARTPVGLSPCPNPNTESPQREKTASSSSQSQQYHPTSLPTLQDRRRIDTSTQSRKTARQEEMWGALQRQQPQPQPPLPTPHNSVSPDTTRTDLTMSKIRRVAKPPRIRIHWTCHQCDTEFGRDRACTWCGHRRCDDCIRSPVRRGREPPPLGEEEDQMPTEVEVGAMQQHRLDGNRTPELQVDSDTSHEPGNDMSTFHPPDEEITMVDSDSATLTHPSTTTMSSSSLSSNHVHHTNEPPEDANIHVSLAHRCSHRFTPTSSPACSRCLHIRFPGTPALDDDESSAHEESTDAKNPTSPPKKSLLPRVYKSPRQYVRYTCHNCQTVSLRNHSGGGSQRCATCAHQQCEACPREPPLLARTTGFQGGGSGWSSTKTLASMSYRRAGDFTSVYVA